MKRLAIVLVLLFPAIASAEMRFTHHYIDRDLPGASYGQTSLVDVDKDGDLDFITGGRDGQRNVFWFEYRSADEWVRHVVGSAHPSDVGGAALDRSEERRVGKGWTAGVS